MSHKSIGDTVASLYDSEKKTKRHREKPCETEEEIEVMLSQSKDSLEPPEGVRGKELFSPRAFRGTIALLIP